MQPCPESSPSAPSPFLGGEINGMMLIGLINSLRNIQIISAGLAAQMAEGQPGKDVEMGDCIKQADEALYRSKRNGRNQVTWFMGCAN